MRLADCSNRGRIAATPTTFGPGAGPAFRREPFYEGAPSLSLRSLGADPHISLRFMHHHERGCPTLRVFEGWVPQTMVSGAFARVNLLSCAKG